MLHSIKWQQVINEELSNLLYQAKENQQTAAVSLLSLSILYGALHAIGPGHGKMIVTTFLATHPSKVKHSLILTVVSAFMQALVAILLVSSLVFLFNNSMRDVNGKAVELINLSFLVMIGLGGMIIFRAVKKLFSSGKVIEKHEQGDCHGCGHKHFADADEINTATTWQAYAGIIISIGIRPCSGAILALLFANMLGIYWLGVMSAFMMALGTAISTSAIALLTLSGKKLINQYLHHDEHKNSTGNSLLQLLGGVLLTLMGLLLFNTPTYGVSPIF
ncbi:nickel/cobalt transporter [Psychromonas sp.]|uniref:nickel/cobalt transporter n=1 Tax=Psychromonas sp. TaxID=1884585 RepID=UPI003565FB94